MRGEDCQTAQLCAPPKYRTVSCAKARDGEQITAPAIRAHEGRLEIFMTTGDHCTVTRAKRFSGLSSRTVAQSGQQGGQAICDDCQTETRALDRATLAGTATRRRTRFPAPGSVPADRLPHPAVWRRSRAGGSRAAAGDDGNAKMPGSSACSNRGTGPRRPCRTATPRSSRKAPT